MTIYEKTERLKRLNKALIPEKQEEKARLYAVATGSAISYDKVGSSPTSNNSQELKDAAYSNASIELDNLTRERDQLIYELNADFDAIECDYKRRVAKLYFVDGLSAKTIANKRMHFAYGTIRNYINEIKKSIENNDIK